MQETGHLVKIEHIQRDFFSQTAAVRLRKQKNKQEMLKPSSSFLQNINELEPDSLIPIQH